MKTKIALQITTQVFMKRTTIIETITVLYIILFLYTGIVKLTDYSIFKEQLATSPILNPVSKPVALLLPWTEFAIALLLIIPRWRLKGLLAGLALMLIFTTYVLALLSFSNKLPCSCGGIIQQLSWTQHLIFNGGFILLAIWAIVLQKREIKEKQGKLIGNEYRLSNA
jgi:uncharacterized membrane protein YphA (DoxX/SURF4 family)